MIAHPRLRRAPQIPDTPQRRKLSQQRSIREIVFGMQDGVLTTLGITTGVGAAAPGRGAILLTGLIALVVGALSMGVGEYLGGKTEREVVENTIALETQEMNDSPAAEYAEQVAYYRMKGFTPEESTMIVDRLVQNPEIWLHEMVRDEFGIDPREAESSGLRPAFYMGGSFALGAFLPIAPYIFPVSVASGAITGMILAALALFGIGYAAGNLGGRHPALKGIEIAGYGVIVFIVSYAVGRFIPPLFGLPPMITGG